MTSPVRGGALTGAGGVGMRIPVLAAPTAIPPAGAYTVPASVLYPLTPIFEPWHVWWNGLLLGWSPPAPGTPQIPTSAWTLTELNGWLTLPDGDMRNTERQARWGAFPGLQTFGARTVEATFTFTGYGDRDTLRDVRRVFTPREDPQEQRLWIWAGTRRPEWVMARVDKVAIPSDHEFSLGYHRITISWVATDPIRYGEVEQRAEAPLQPPMTAGGLRFPLRFPTGLDFNAGLGGGGIMRVTNDGLLEVWPMLTVKGPVIGPVIHHLDSGRKLAFSAELVLGRGEELTIDTNNRYAQQGGMSKAHLMTAREWFTLPVGDSRLRYTCTGDYDPDSTLTVTWHTAAII